MRENDQTAADSRSTQSGGQVGSAGVDVDGVLELDGVFAALGHPRQRYLLYTLVRDAGDKTLTELAEKIVAWEQDKPISKVSDDERTRVEVSLYHSHVPKLADLGVLEYQEGENIIVRARNTEQVQAVLGGAGGTTDSQQEAHARETNEQ